MTLPTTRIDTLSPPNSHSATGDSGGSPSITGASDSSQQILLVDFIPLANHSHVLHQNGVVGVGGSSESSGTSGVGATPTNFFPANSYHQVGVTHGLPIQVQPGPVTNHNGGNRHHFNNVISNFTLVNLSNPNENEGEEEEDEEESLIPQPQQKRNSVNHHQNKRGSFSSYPTSTTAAMIDHGGGGGPVVKGKLSSSLSSSSEDSDTGFLVPHHRSHNGGTRVRGNNKEACQYRYHQKQNVPIPLLSSPERMGGDGGGGGNSFQQGTRKRLKRKRSTGRRANGIGRPQSTEASDLFPICCCFAEENNRDMRSTSSPGSSLTSKYLRFSCFIVMIIFIATFTSIMVSLQRKVDSLNFEVNKMNSAAAGNQDIPSVSPDQSNQTNANASLVKDLIAKQELFNASLLSLTLKLTELTERISNLEKQPSIEELRKDLAHLGSEMKGSIEEIQKNIDTLKKKAAEDNRPSANQDSINKLPNSQLLQATEPASVVPRNNQ